MGDPGVERTSHVAVLLGDSVVLAGGTAGGIEVASAQRWQGFKFQPAGTMSIPRRLPTATLLEDGGARRRWRDARQHVRVQRRVLRARGNRWSGAGSMSSVRVGHQAVRLPDGRVLVAGGYTTVFSFTTTTTDIYTPATALAAPGEADLGSQVLETPGTRWG